MRETDGWHLTPPEFLAGENPAVAGKDSAMTIDEHRDAEPEGVNAACDLRKFLQTEGKKMDEIDRLTPYSLGQQFIIISQGHIFPYVQCHRPSYLANSF